MTSAIERMRARLRSFDLTGLLVEELGWDHHRGSTVTISAKEHHFRATPIAEKKGFVVWLCEAGDGRIPSHTIRRQIETQITRHAFEHLIVFVDDARREQVWQWVRREAGTPDASREYTYRAGQTGEPVLQRLRALKFGLDEEESLTISLVANRVKGALNAEKVTKRFYNHFQEELKNFQRFIEGIEGSADVDWYASLMLNRLMFIYFIQRRGFLDGDLDYLRSRLERVREARGPDSFHDFYRIFLRRLFHEGLGRPKAERSPDLTALLGEVPFLNGGIFDVHDLERDNPDLRIRDEAFERLFDLFDRYAWHLDERPRAKDNEINPDVLGHIFEKSINQKEKGAYYTKEDVTGYMAESAIIPRLLDMAAERMDGVIRSLPQVFDLLAQDPDRYIRPPVGHGLSWDARDTEDPVRIDPPLELPYWLTAGIGDPTKRTTWDQSTSQEMGPPLAYAHPHETWRQLVARRERYAKVRETLASGGVRDANDLVTLNLDGQRLVLDAIRWADQPEVVRAFWHAATNISVLDPTCGSGAFLFAALKILEPVYAACLARMRDLRPMGAGEVLAELDRHPNDRYFILKSIVLNNLYGVDIMKEATEICKLRLFLKLVAQLSPTDQIEPLPDIDFNIRSGNALVGFSSVRDIKKAFKGDMVKELALPDIVARAERAGMAFARFQQIQTEAGAEAATIRNAKQDLRRRMNELRDQLDRHLASDYGISLDQPGRFNDWRVSHQPFHWCAEFFGVMEGLGGFDVVIGNPPYIGMNKVRKRYALTRGFRTASCPDVYAPVVERSLRVTRTEGRIGMILPLSVTFGRRYDRIRDFIYEHSSSSWFSSFGRIPAALFSADVRVRNTIVIGRKTEPDSDCAGASGTCFTTRLHRWFEDERPTLFDRLAYSACSPSAFGGLVPKIGSSGLITALEELLQSQYRFRQELLHGTGIHPLHFKQSGYNWITFCSDKPPVIGPQGQLLEQTQYSRVGLFADKATRDMAMMILNGRLMFLWWIAVGDDFHLTKTNCESAPFGPEQLASEHRSRVGQVVPYLKEAMAENVTYKQNAGKQIGNYNLALCRDVTDRADKILLDALGLPDLWDEIELEYSLVVRTEFGGE